MFVTPTKITPNVAFVVVVVVDLDFWSLRTDKPSKSNKNVDYRYDKMPGKK